MDIALPLLHFQEKSCNPYIDKPHTTQKENYPWCRASAIVSLKQQRTEWKHLQSKQILLPYLGSNEWIFILLNDFVSIDDIPYLSSHSWEQALCVPVLQVVSSFQIPLLSQYHLNFLMSGLPYQTISTLWGTDYAFYVPAFSLGSQVSIYLKHFSYYLLDAKQIHTQMSK